MYYYIFELSGEHLELSTNEVLSVLYFYGFVVYSSHLINKYFFVSIDENIINIKKLRFFLTRDFKNIISFTHSISEVFLTSKYDDNNNFINLISLNFDFKSILDIGTKFIVRAKVIEKINFSKSEKSKLVLDLEKNIGNMIYKKGYCVSLKNPNFEFKVYIFNSILIFCSLLSHVST